MHMRATEKRKDTNCSASATTKKYRLLCQSICQNSDLREERGESKTSLPVDRHRRQPECQHPVMLLASSFFCAAKRIPLTNLGTSPRDEPFGLQIVCTQRGLNLRCTLYGDTGAKVKEGLFSPTCFLHSTQHCAAGNVRRRATNRGD